MSRWTRWAIRLKQKTILMSPSMLAVTCGLTEMTPTSTLTTPYRVRQSLHICLVALIRQVVPSCRFLGLSRIILGTLPLLWIPVPYVSLEMSGLMLVRQLKVKSKSNILAPLRVTLARQRCSLFQHQHSIQARTPLNLQPYQLHLIPRAIRFLLLKARLFRLICSPSSTHGGPLRPRRPVFLKLHKHATRPRRQHPG